jgi:hypothetical protein
MSMIPLASDNTGVPVINLVYISLLNRKDYVLKRTYAQQHPLKEGHHAKVAQGPWRD